MKSSGAKVNHVSIYQRPDGRSRGCGHVEFAASDDVAKAITLHNADLMGRPVFIREDRVHERKVRLVVKQGLRALIKSE